MKKEELTTRKSDELMKQEAKKERELPVIRPAVDIIEEADAYKMYVDLPGVNADSLNVKMERHELTIDGVFDLNLPDKLREVYREFTPVRYHRSFTLGEAIDENAIKAELRHGVLELTLPKAQEARARMIEVKAS
ncbi:MAG: Hsp20/alpha crystallin family protein [Lentisphaerae bacterium]|nr:MAG: Hsp20/alpha crystallin family protein [Lentisphaerota bacterium]